MPDPVSQARCQGAEDIRFDAVRLGCGGDALRASCPYEQEESNEEQHDRVRGFPAAVGGLEFRNPGSQGANAYR